MIDFRKLLFAYPGLVVGMQNIQKSIERLKKTEKQYPSGVASYSDMPNAKHIQSMTERFAIRNVEMEIERDNRIKKLEEDLENYKEAVELVESIMKTLNDEVRTYTKLRYFQCRSVEEIAEIMHVQTPKCHAYRARLFKAMYLGTNNGLIDLALDFRFDQHSRFRDHF